jgi:DNA repair protein RadC
LVQHGAESLSDAELLAIILRVGDGERTAIDLARHLITRFGGFRGLDGKSVAELCKVNGIGVAKAAQMKAALEMGKRLLLETPKEKAHVASSEDAYELVRPHMANLGREVFRVLLLTSRNTVISDRVLFEGSLTESIVSPRELVKAAVNEGAASVVLIHNHPSGDPRPSDADRRVTLRLKQACEVVGVAVLDHLIVGNDDYYSFADHGLL